MFCFLHNSVSKLSDSGEENVFTVKLSHSHFTVNTHCLGIEVKLSQVCEVCWWLDFSTHVHVTVGLPSDSERPLCVSETTWSY